MQLEWMEQHLDIRIMELRVVKGYVVLHTVLILASNTQPTERPACFLEKCPTSTLSMPSRRREGSTIPEYTLRQVGSHSLCTRHIMNTALPLYTSHALTTVIAARIN